MFSLEREYNGWSLERITRHILYWGFWVTFYCVLNAAYQRTGYLQWLWLELMFMTVKIPYAYFVAYFLFPKFLPRKRYVILFALVLLFAFVGVGFMVLLLKVLPQFASGQPSIFWSAKSIFRALDLIYVASLVVVVKMIQRFFRQERMNERLKAEKIGSELQMLKNQLQPHFLLNTLNNIYGLVLDGDKKAGSALIQLSNIINYMLYDCNVDSAELQKEIDLLKNYLELEKIRYGERLDLSFEVEGAIAENKIAPLLLIPFVENSFKHGVSQSQGKSWVRILIQVSANQLSFQIENSIATPTDSTPDLKSGIGLENVRKRLNLIYPGAYQLDIISNETFLVNLKINL
ncbi:sensor histidine kinase [Flagellimonas meridianipacifica]|uniref:Histidine kinase n=1 Tax=Flagellimonas meridianipacifica TaxID=1080225 RepID=A0A2T0M9W8_9FLAO|nr:histidine kinase [Allomuricauda pacifica]PRX54270.1 histidine kinase [Allomuricauda pacifica]